MTAVLAIARWRMVSKMRGTLEITVGAVVTGATVLPAFLGFAEPVQRGAVVVAWLKTITGVLVCGALLALGNWIYTLCAIQWSQTGLPAMPPMVVKPGGGELPVAGAVHPGTGQTARASQPQSSWLGRDEYRD